MTKPELLAPAGKFDCFNAAVNAGADAIYLAGKEFGARASAENFTQDEIIKVLDIAHLHDRKIYLTLNTLIKEREWERIEPFLRPLYDNGLDGVIIQDLGLISFLKEEFPLLPIHASTQMSITGPYAANLLKDKGVIRIVPARELSLDEIISLKEETGLEIETFIHGAMCYCYSGRCLFSSYLGGRSGNRGRCAQPCRLNYTITKGDKYIEKDSIRYPLSLKDMCTITCLDKLIDAGIDSFKIEGRMKSPQYVAGVTSIYRKYIDMYTSENEFRIDQAVCVHGGQGRDNFLRFGSHVAVHDLAVPQYPVGVAAGESGRQAVGAEQRLHRGDGTAVGVVLAVSVGIFLGEAAHQGDKVVHGLRQGFFGHAQLVQPVAAVDQGLVGHGAVGLKGRDNNHLSILQGSFPPGVHVVGQVAVGSAAQNEVVDVRGVFLQEILIPALDDALIIVAVQHGRALGQEHVGRGIAGQPGVQDFGVVGLLNVNHFDVHIDAVLLLQHLLHERSDNVLLVVNGSEHVAGHGDLDRLIFGHGSRYQRDDHHQGKYQRKNTGTFHVFVLLYIFEGDIIPSKIRS